ncbi:MAG: restriction endonuclease subunit S [Propionicimonas sp.]
MSVPRGWEVVTLSEVAETALGKMLDKGRPKGYRHVPYLRNVNVQWGRIDTDNLLTMELADNERERFAVVRGDLLVCEGGEVGRAAIWERDHTYIAYQKALHRIRPSDRLDSRFLRYYLEHAATTGALNPLTTGSTIKHLPQQSLRRLSLPLPPIDEQRRIVEILEDHLSRLDAAEEYLRASLRRIHRYDEAAVMAMLGCANGDGSAVARIIAGDLPQLEEGWSWVTLGEVAEVVGGVTKDQRSSPTRRSSRCPTYGSRTCNEPGWSSM